MSDIAEQNRFNSFIDTSASAIATAQSPFRKGITLQTFTGEPVLIQDMGVVLDRSFLENPAPRSALGMPKGTRFTVDRDNKPQAPVNCTYERSPAPTGSLLGQP